MCVCGLGKVNKQNKIAFKGLKVIALTKTLLGGGGDSLKMHNKLEHFPLL